MNEIDRENATGRMDHAELRVRGNVDGAKGIMKLNGWDTMTGELWWVVALQPWTGCNKKTAVSVRLKAVGVPKKLFGKIQMLIFAPNLSTNLANHAGWAGQAGAVTRLPSTWAASMATATY